MASLSDLIPLVEELKRAGYSDADIPGIIQRLHAGGYHQSMNVVSGQVETEREQDALAAAAKAQEARANTGISLLDDARMRSQQLIDLQRDPDNIVSYFAAIAGLPEQGASPVQSLLGSGFKLEPTLPSPYSDPNYLKLRDSLYDFGRPRTVEENVAETARGRQAQLNQFAADQYRKDPNAFLKWTQATRGMASGGQMKIDEPMVAIGTASGQPRFTIGEYGDEKMGKDGRGLQITPLTSAQGEVPGNVQQMMFRMVGLPAQQIEDTVKAHAKGGKVPDYATGGFFQGRTFKPGFGFDANTRSSTKAAAMSGMDKILFNLKTYGTPFGRGGVPRESDAAAGPNPYRTQKGQDYLAKAGYTASNALLPSTAPTAASTPTTPSVPSSDPNAFLEQTQQASMGIQQAAQNPAAQVSAGTLVRRNPFAVAQSRFPNFAGGGSLTPVDAAFDAAAKIYEKNPFVGVDFMDALRQRRPPPPGSITQRFLANSSPSGWQALQAAIRGRIGGTALDDYLAEVPRFFAQGAPPTSVRYV